MKLSVIIPCFNLKDRIFNIYDKLKDYFKNIRYELIIIDNGSDDSTIEKIKELYNSDMQHIKIIILEKKYTIDEIYKIGIKNAAGEYICLYDVNVSANEISTMYDLIINDNCDIVTYQFNVENKLLDFIYRVGDKICSTNLEKACSNCRIFNKKVKEYFIKYCDYYCNLKEIFNLMGFKENYFKGNYIINKSSILKMALKDIDNYLKNIKNSFFWKEFIIGFILLIVSFIYLITIILLDNMEAMYFLIFIIMFFSSLLIILITQIGNKLMKRYSSDYNAICIVREKMGFENDSLL